MVGLCNSFFLSFGKVNSTIWVSKIIPLLISKQLFGEMMGSSECIDFCAFSAAVAWTEQSYQRKRMLLRHSHLCTCTGLSSAALSLSLSLNRANLHAFVLLHLKNVDVSMKSAALHNDSTVLWARNFISILQKSNCSTLCKTGPKYFAPWSRA